MKLTPERKAAFLAALVASGGNVSRACQAVDICRMTAYEWRDEDKVFAVAWEKAKSAGLDALEDEALRRAFDGVDEPVFHQGQPTYVYERDERGEIVFDEHVTEVPDGEGGMRRVVNQKPRYVLDSRGNPRVMTKKGYSDTLAIFLLKGGKPEKYKERVEHSGQIDMASRIVAARKRSGG